MSMLVNWLLMTLAILATAYVLPGVALSGFGGALVVALVLGILNTFIKPLLILLTLPINILTLGLFTFVINALLMMLTSALVPGFKLDGFLTALIFSVVLSTIVYLSHLIFA